MVHDEQTVAERLPEPPDGARLVVDNGDGEYKVIWRDDEEAGTFDSHAEDRWFSDPDEDPMGLYQHVKYARAVYAVGSPLAVFAESDGVDA
jgi:hypothetical protein